MTTQAAVSHFSRPALLTVGAVILLSIAAAIAGRIVGPTGLANPAARVVSERGLIFADRTDGGVDVIDADTHGQIAILPAGSNNFLRATMRVLAHQRIRHDGTADTPFRLAAWDDGRLTLSDPATKRTVGLEAFGIDNETVFARLLTARNTP